MVCVGRKVVAYPGGRYTCHEEVCSGHLYNPYTDSLLVRDKR